MNLRKVWRRAKRLPLLVLSNASFLLLGMLHYRIAGYAVFGAAVLFALWQDRKTRPPSRVAVHLMLLAAIAVDASRTWVEEADWPMVLATAILVVLIGQEATVSKADSGGRRFARLKVARISPVLGKRLVSIDTALLGLAALTVLFDIESWPLLGLVALVAGLGMMTVMMAKASWRAANEKAAIRLALEKLQPKFAVHFSAPPGSEYQLTMWLPYLERIGAPFVILLRESNTFAAVTKVTSAPVLVCPSMDSLEQALVPSLKAVFYVNNGIKNAHCVRFAQFTHVQLLHGDSDKAPSFNPVTAMFDKVYVAGQAGIDRYIRNGIEIPAEKFAIVGRPQVEGINQAAYDIGSLADKTVLYTPTWVGYYTDSNYCSLPLSEGIVGNLLAAGATVILRHHPYTTRDAASAAHLARAQELLAADKAATGRPHLWGPAATSELTAFECMNHADAMVSDVSSVVSDFLYSGKPICVVDAGNEGPEFPVTFPLAEAAYVLAGDLSNIDGVLHDLLVRDPKAGVRRALKRYYLGDFSHDRYADGFVEAARSLLTGRREAQADDATMEIPRIRV
jgi:hypothetical protein